MRFLQTNKSELEQIDTKLEPLYYCRSRNGEGQPRCHVSIYIYIYEPESSRIEREVAPYNVIFRVPESDKAMSGMLYSCNAEESRGSQVVEAMK